MRTDSAEDVRSRLGAHLLVDGLPLVLDLKASHGTTLVDQATGEQYLDMFTFFASSALGMNHPMLVDDATFREELLDAAMNKPSNSDVYTEAMARFVDTFARVMGDPALPHYFFIEGGAAAVENALKVCFDWKSRHNESQGRSPELGTRVLHLRDAFHGRSGYTMSLTNTEPGKVARYPKFDWPRLSSPYLSEGRDMDRVEAHTLAEAEQAFAAHPHDIACFIAEPIQAEGGDHHFRPQFLRAMRDLCHANDALFVLDEVQTGGGMTGKPWAYQVLDVQPDVVSFGKKLQVCGLMSGGRVDEVPDNVFRVPSRINSTWGGNLTDMVRSRRILEVIESEALMDNAAIEGDHLLSRLTELCERHPAASNARGLGLMCAITLPDRVVRDALLGDLLRDHVIMLGCGERSLRVRPPLTVTRGSIDRACDALDHALTRWDD
ncbi:L-lysine 6-transaminase [Aestuariimicrobium sp. T2.26MG-19.2B]|uniref:L-lysine 6-transaminase n=1 Tax=Aestuariimicrobium sp. T2.26MG-19.2B TaxID=3040679 RepID=UPI002477BE0A|nr:L-lysine 6-transaminase [Aestuariimicrobium sp. T2.26MG-19.2B]CAI9409616.1 putative L-lysine-epsilon aminotransferase [Aestuariimicrobium sp. T2.26MG-19.2B]